MRFFFMLFTIALFWALTGCAHKVIRQDCEQQGQSQYFLCKDIPWWQMR